MAATSLLALLDDITTLLDDVATMTKTAASKTAGVLGDDLAVNAEQVTGMRAERELPVIWSVFKGALLNKIILVPLALLFAYFAPWVITPVLVLGGLYLCFEGAEKLLAQEHHHAGAVEQLSQLSNEQLIQYEQDKIKGAVRTDFVLSIEIIVITLGAIAQASFAQQASVLAIVAAIATIGVYGIVALIVKIDDFGLYLFQRAENKQQLSAKLGLYLLQLAPKILKLLTFIGTWAMFLVAGGIFAHAFHGLESHVIMPAVSFIEQLWSFSGWQGLVALVLPLLLEIVSGLMVGILLFKSHQLWHQLRATH